MSTDPSGVAEFSGPRSRVHRHGLADDEAIGHKFADGLTGVGVADLADFVGIEPDLALTAADHRGGEPLLGAEVHPVHLLESSSNEVFRRWRTSGMRGESATR